MSDVLINFSVDLSQLQPALDILDQIAAKGGAIGAQWKSVATAMNTGNASAVQSTVKLAASVDDVVDSQKDVAAQAKVTATAMDTQNKTGIEGSDKLSKSIEGLATASKSMDKIVIGAAYKQSLKEIQDQLGLTNKEVISFVLNARKAAQTAILTATDDQEIKDLNISIEVMNDQLKQFGVNADGTTDKTKLLTSELRAMKDELIKMDPSNPKFEVLKDQVVATQKEITNLNKEVKGLGSDTRNIDGLISIMTGLAGGFAIVQGAQALFADGNEELQKALVKVQAAMSIAQGLQQVGNVLQKESSASIFLNSLLRKKQSEAIVQTNVAEGTNIALTETQTAKTAIQTTTTEGAAAAQKGLNVAMLASPIGILVLSVGTLIGLYEIFSSRAENVTRSLENMNRQMELQNQMNDRFADAIGKAGEILLAQAVNRGAKVEELRRIETNTLKDQLDEAKKVEDSQRAAYERAMEVRKAFSEGKLDLNAKEIAAENETVKNFEIAEKKTIDLARQLELKSVNNSTAANKEKLQDVQAYQNARIAATIAGSDKERQVQIESIQAIGKARESDADFRSKSDAEKALIRANDDKQIQNLRLQNYQHLLKGRTAATDAELAIAKAHQATSDADQIASINKITELQIASIKKQRTESLANPTLNADERQKITDEANAAIVEAEKKKQQDILNVQKTELSNQIAAAQKGSYDEYIYKLALIENSRQAEIAAAGKNADLIKSIDDKYRKQKQDEDTRFNEIQLSNEISVDNALLSNFLLTEKQKLPLVIQRLDDQEKLEISAADKNASKIYEIKAKYDAQRLAAEKSAIEAQLALELKSLEVYGQKTKVINQQIVSDPLANVNKRIIANNALQIAEEKRIDRERISLKEELINKVISYEQYYLKLKDLDNQEAASALTHSQNSVQIFKEEQDKKLAILQSTISVIQGSLDALDTSGIKTGLNEALGLFTKIGEAVAAYRLAQKDPNADQAAAKQAETQAILTSSILAVQATVNQVYADASARRQQDLNDHLQGLEAQKNAELDNANLTAKQKDEINKQYAKKERQAKIAAFNADKEAKKQQIIIEGALNIVKAFPNFVLMAIAAATTAIEIAAVASTPTPRFRHGEVSIDTNQWHKPYTGQVGIKGPGTGTSDSIPAMISNGESVIAAKPTAKWKEVLHAINNDKFESYLDRRMHEHRFIYPHIPDHVRPIHFSKMEIDYDRLAETIANRLAAQLPEPTYVQNTMDENGMHSFVKKGNSKTEYKNKRYSMK